jgi:hypothetical protein
VYLCVGVSPLPLSVIFFLVFWNCLDSVAFFVFHFIVKDHSSNMSAMFDLLLALLILEKKLNVKN